MTTVNTIVQDAMLAARVIGVDQTVSDADGQLVLRHLNRMLDSWSNERQMIYANVSETFTMAAGTQSYSTSLLSNGRPLNINSARVSLNNLDWPVSQIDQQKWNAITYKLTQSIPRWFYYDDGFPNATFYFYPIPYAAFTCTLYCQRVLSGALAIGDDLSLPPGYEAAIIAGLAVNISPSFGKQPTPAMVEEMRQTRAVLKRLNYQPLEMVTVLNNGYDVSNDFPYRTF